MALYKRFDEIPIPDKTKKTIGVAPYANTLDFRLLPKTFNKISKAAITVKDVLKKQGL